MLCGSRVVWHRSRMDHLIKGLLTRTVSAYTDWLNAQGFINAGDRTSDELTRTFLEEVGVRPRGLCEYCGLHTTHRDDAMNRRCNGCEHIVRLCCCGASTDDDTMDLHGGLVRRLELEPRRY